MPVSDVNNRTRERLYILHCQLIALLFIALDIMSWNYDSDYLSNPFAASSVDVLLKTPNLK